MREQSLQREKWHRVTTDKARPFPLRARTRPMTMKIRVPRSAAALLALVVLLTPACSYLRQPPTVQPSEREHAMFALFPTESWLLAIPPVVKNDHGKYIVDATAPIRQWELHSDLNFMKKEDCESLRLKHFENYDPAKGYPSLSDESDSRGRLQSTALRNSICVWSADPDLKGATIIQDFNNDETRAAMQRAFQKICSEKGQERLCGQLKGAPLYSTRRTEQPTPTPPWWREIAPLTERLSIARIWRLTERRAQCGLGWGRS